MFTLIQGLPKNVLGVEAHGRITDDDYRTVLIPRANEMLEKSPAIKLLYVAGKDFKGYDAHAVWDDVLFGLKHWSHFSCVVLVTDVDWLRGAAHFFSPFVPAAVKVFDLADLAAARTWITRNRPAATRKSSDTLKQEFILPTLHTIRHAVTAAEKRLDKAAARRRKRR